MWTSGVILALHLLTTALVCASNELHILQSPPGVQFNGDDELDVSTLKEVFSTVVGLTPEHDSSWTGISISNPTQLARALVAIVVDGDLADGFGGMQYPLDYHGNDEEVFETVMERAEWRDPQQTSKYIYADLSNNGLDVLEEDGNLRGIKDIDTPVQRYNALKLNVAEDKHFVQQLHVIEALSERLGALSADEAPLRDIYWLKVTGLQALAERHGENSTVVREAQTLLRRDIERLRNAFVDVYGENVLVSVLNVNDGGQVKRSKREVPEQEPLPRVDKQYNLAATYDENYPVIFNLILWFSVVMIFSLLAVAITIAEMDPGRDSIIYRMTSTRMKKDN